MCLLCFYIVFELHLSGTLKCLLYKKTVKIGFSSKNVIKSLGFFFGLISVNSRRKNFDPHRNNTGNLSTIH